ncbi:MAG: BatA domain-containing protein [Flavobacteriales bacterium]
MQLGQPLMLYFLLAIAFVILIHLLNLQKFRKIYFSNIQILKQVVNAQKKRSKLEQFFLMFIRSLIVASLVLAFSQLFWGKQNQFQDQNYISVYIDNSLSASRQLGEPTLLQLQKKHAKDLITSLGNSKQYQLLSNDLSSRKDLRFTDQQSMLEKIQALELSNFSKPSDYILSKLRQNRATEALHSNELSRFYLSDFQSNQHQLNDLVEDSIQTVLLPLNSSQNTNVSLDWVKVEQAFLIENQSIDLKVKLTNHADQAFSSLPLKLFIGSKQKLIQNVDLEPNSSKTIDLALHLKPRDSTQIHVQIEDQALDFDNHFYLSLESKSTLKLAYIYAQKPKAEFKALYQKPHFDLQQFKEKNLSNQQFSDFDFLILDQLDLWNSSLIPILNSHAKKGKPILLIPSESSISNFNNFAKQLGLQNIDLQINNIEVEHFKMRLNHPIYQQTLEENNADFDGLKTVSLLVPKTKHPNEKAIIESQDGRAFLSSLDYQNAQVFILYAATSGESNFHEHSLFAALGINMAHFQNQSQKRALTLGQFDRFELDNSVNESDLTLNYLSKPKAFGLEQFNQKTYLSIDERFDKPGFLTLQSKGKTWIELGLNQNRKESQMDFLSMEHLEQMAEKHNHIELINPQSKTWQQFVNQQDETKSIAFYFVILALLFYLIEMLFLYFKNRKTAV